jgi:hypothetical protein
VVTPVALPTPGPGVREPHAAIDPAHPDRMAVAAMMYDEGGEVTRSIYVWQSEDAGATWQGARVELPLFDEEGVADPLVAYTTDGTLLVVGMALSRQLADAVMSAYYTRENVPSTEESIARLLKDIEGIRWSDTVVVARVAPDGRTLGGTALRGTIGADKPAVAVDRNPGSPHHGSIYITWHDLAKDGRFYVARSTDDGRTFGDRIPIVDERWGAFISQLAVRPDGSLHTVWTAISMVLPDAPPEAATSVWHSVSHDGGRTFSPPKPIATHGGLDLIGIPTLAMDAEGRLLAVWGQGESIPEDQLKQVRHRLYAVRSDDGETWSEPALVSPETPPTTMMALPTAAGSKDAFWILTYLADDTGTEVVLLRSDDCGETFSPAETLARRGIPVDDIFLVGRYLLIRCADVARIGEYAGLTAVGPHLLAAFVLPETDETLSQTTAYAVVRAAG